jgi:multidrug efflux pump subunit AcrA (membrane-fusion protein)
VEEGGKAVRRKVELGRERDLEVEVLQGLKTGDHLIVEGFTLVEPGAKVKTIL